MVSWLGDAGDANGTDDWRGSSRIGGKEEGGPDLKPLRNATLP